MHSPLTRALVRLAAACLFVLALAPAAARADGKLEIRFFDVGQGDAALIRSPTGKRVLIDGGPPEAGAELARKVAADGAGPLDLVILSHPHLDHLGGLAAVLRAVGAQRFIDPGFDHPSKAYSELLGVVKEKAGQVMVPQPDPARPNEPLTIGLGGGAQLQILWPRAPVEPFLFNTRSDANSNSIVARVTYGKTAVLFTGDSEADTEQRLLRRKELLAADLLKVAHHGSRHSSGAAFLDAVAPKLAVISCGKGNDYGHPGGETLQRLAHAGARVFRTDLLGDVEAVSDGAEVQVRPYRPRADVASAVGGFGAGLAQPQTASANVAEGGPFVAARVSHVFHKSDCPGASRFKPQNRVYFGSRDAAAKERKPAEDCNP